MKAALEYKCYHQMAERTEYTSFDNLVFELYFTNDRLLLHIYTEKEF